MKTELIIKNEESTIELLVNKYRIFNSVLYIYINKSESIGQSLHSIDISYNVDSYEEEEVVYCIKRMKHTYNNIFETR